MAITLEQHTKLKTTVTIQIGHEETYLNQLEQKIKKKNKKSKALNRKRRNTEY